MYMVVTVSLCLSLAKLLFFNTGAGVYHHMEHAAVSRSFTTNLALWQHMHTSSTANAIILDMAQKTFLYWILTSLNKDRQLALSPWNFCLDYQTINTVSS